MFSRLSDTLRRYAKGWLIVLLFLLDSLFMGLILPIAHALMKSDSGGPGPIDLKFFYTPEKVYGMIDAYGEYGRSLYRNIELTVDILYPIIYTLFFSLFITWLFQRGLPPASQIQQLNVVPFGTWLFDLLENMGIVGMLSIYPSIPDLLAWVTAIFTLVKWLFVGASIILMMIGITASINKTMKQ